MALSGGDGGGGSSGAVRAGGAYVELGTKDALLTAGLKKGARDVAAWSAATAALTGAVLAKATGTLGDLSRIGEIAQATGAPVEKLSGLFGVMEASGQGIKESIEAVSQFGTAINDAIQGKGENAAELFKILGASAQDFKQVDIAEGIFRLFDGLEKVQDPLDKTRALSLAFGTDGMKLLLPMLNRSGAELRQQAQLYAVTGEQVQQARQATLAYAGASAAVSRAWRSVAVAVAPTVTAIATGVEAAVGWTARLASAAAALGPQLGEPFTFAAQSVQFFGQQVLKLGLITDVANVVAKDIVDAFTTGLSAAGLVVNGFADDVLKTMQQVASGIVLSINGAFQTVSKSITGLAVIAGRSGFTQIQKYLNILSGSFSLAGPQAGNAAGVGLDSIKAGFGQFKFGAFTGIAQFGLNELLKRFGGAFAGKAPPAFGNGAGGAPGFVGGASRGGFLGGGPSALATLGGSVPQQQLNELKKLNDKVGALPEKIAAATQLRAT